jgi:hypothetical protein
MNLCAGDSVGWTRSGSRKGGECFQKPLKTHKEAGVVGNWEIGILEIGYWDIGILGAMISNFYFPISIFNSACVFVWGKKESPFLMVIPGSPVASGCSIQIN